MLKRALDSWIVAASAIAVAAALFVLKERYLAVIALSAAIGWTSCKLAEPIKFESAPDSSTRYVATVFNVDERESSRAITVRVDGQIVGDAIVKLKPFKIDITDPSFIPSISPGDIISFNGQYGLPRKDVDLPMEDDLSDYYYTRGITLTCFSAPDSITISGRSGNILLAAKRLRDKIVDKICDIGLDQPTTAFMAAVLSGDDSLLESETRQSFSRSGIAHVLALSGAHVAIIAAILSLLFLPLSMAGHHKLRWLLVAAALWAFAIMTGLSSSVVRSVLMATAVIGALILDRPRSSLNSLILAAIVILIFDPVALFRPGFQLSFLATCGIIIFSNHLNPFGHKRKRLRAIGEMVTVTLAATIMTLPAVAYHFHQIPIYFFIANIIVVALMPVLLTGGIVLLTASALGFTMGWLADALDGIYGFIAMSSEKISNLPSAIIDKVYLEPIVIALIFCCIFVFYLWLTRRRAVYGLILAITVMTTISVGFLTQQSYASSELFVTRETTYTNVIGRHGDKATIISTADELVIAGDSARWERNYRDHFATRGVKRLTIIGISDYGTNNGEIATVDFDGKKIAIITRKPTAGFNQKFDYLLVTRGFSGDIVELANTIKADTILLSNDIAKRRHQRYAHELEEAGISHQSLRDAPFHLSRP